MDYEKHYYMLMEKSKNRVLTGYVEKHHILPKCLGGTDDSENIAVLTPEEHFVAHQLLIKMHPGNRDLIYATQLMTVHHTASRTNNKLFGWIRKQCALAMSTQTKNWIKENGHPRGMLGKKHDIRNLPNITAGLRKANMEKRIEIYAYELDGTFYKKFDSISECATYLKTNASNVKYTADGKFKHCKKKQLRYEYSESIDPYVKPKLPKRVRSKEHCENISKAKKGKKKPAGWAERHSETMKNYHKRKKEIKALTGYSRIGRNNV